MSTAALSMVWENSRQDGSKLLILLAIADSINRETQSTWLSLDFLAKKARVSRRTVLDQLPTLEHSTELTVEHGAGPKGCNVYSLGPFYRWGADFAPPPSKADAIAEDPATSGGGADSARVQSGYAVSHPYRIVPSPLSDSLEAKVLTGTGAKSAPPSAPRVSHDQTPWIHALLVLKKTLNKADYDTWVRDTEILSISNGSVVIGARNSYGAEWLREHVALNVAQALAQALGRQVKVAFEVAPPSPLPSSLGE